MSYPLLEYLLQQRCRDVVEPPWSVLFNQDVEMLYLQEKLLLFYMLYPQEKLVFPSCHTSLALVLLHSCKIPSWWFASTIPMYSRLCPWLFTWPDLEEFDKWRRIGRRLCELGTFSQSVACRVMANDLGSALLKWFCYSDVKLGPSRLLCKYWSCDLFVIFLFHFVMDDVTLISVRLCVHGALIMGSWTVYITGILDS